MSEHEANHPWRPLVQAAKIGRGGVKPTPLDLVQRMEDIKNPRGLFAFKEAITKADPAIAVTFETSNYGNTLWVVLVKGEQRKARIVQGEQPYWERSTGERWWESFDLLAVEEYGSEDTYDEMRARVVAQLVAEVQEPAGGGG